MVVQHLHTVPGVSSNLTFTTNFISLKCYLVAFAVWGRRVLVRILLVAPYKNTLVYRHREVVKDNDKQQPVCFYMVLYKNTLSI